MRKILLLTTLVAGLVAAPQAFAKTVTIQIQKTGFSPAKTMVAKGDTVVWKNVDTAQHQIVSDDGSVKSPVLAPGQTFSYVFRADQTFSYHGGIHPDLKGAIEVASVTLSASRRSITYGTGVTLSGSLSTATAGQTVTIRMKPFNRPVRIVHATTDAYGSWSLRVFPVVQTRFEATAGTLASSPSVVFVRPRIVLRKMRNGYFAVSVFDVNTLAHNYIWISRWSASAHQYRHTAKIFLRPSKRATIWNATFRLRVRRGTRLKAFIYAYQAGPGYSFGASNRVIV
jgi:plastocyanin